MSTIFALSSGALPSAIAVVRLTGSKSAHVLRELTGRKVLKPRKMFYTKLLDKDRSLIDSAMAVYLQGPLTFTGEDTAELYCHGSRAVVDTLARRLTEFDGVRHAYRGEFSKRAFYNGKMDLSEVRGLRDLIDAETDRQRRVAQREMGAGAAVKEIRDRLAEVVGRVTLLIDFGEHVDSTLEDVRLRARQVLSLIQVLSRGSKSAEIVHRGLRAVLVGRPNTGKSTILNKLAGRDVAIVSAIEGTTRDSLEVRLSISGIPCTLTDTAGLRESQDPIEQEGIRRSKKRVEEADIVIAVVDARYEQEEVAEVVKLVEEFDDDKVVIVVRNKIDLLPQALENRVSETPKIVTSTVSSCGIREDGLDKLTETLEQLVEELCPEESGPCLTDYALVREAEEQVEAAILQEDAALCAQYLQNALDIMGELAGSTVTEAVLDRLFQQFCIGK